MAELFSGNQAPGQTVQHIHVPPVVGVDDHRQDKMRGKHREDGLGEGGPRAGFEQERHQRAERP